ncbi:MAG: CCA tRNA nucleotidyltransferase [Actinomycetota bacterium]
MTGDVSDDDGPKLDPSKPLGQLPPQPWMEAPETRKVVAALTAEGAEVRFVGGCVRDAVLKRPIKDIDIATHDPPERVMALLDKAGIHVIPTGIAHGTVTAVIGKEHFEITTLREDVETFGRHARVAFTDDWAADAARRDFTMNTLFADPKGRIYDPFNGLQDMGAGRVRFVGDPMKRIGEDVLRLLRFFRFHAHYGRPPMDRQALSACRRMAPKLVNLSGERVSGEIIRLLQAPDPASVLLVMRNEHVLRHVLPEGTAFGRLRVLCWLESRAMVRPSVRPDPIRRLGALVETDHDGAVAVGERLKLSNHQTARLVAIAAPKLVPAADMDDRAVRRALHKVGADTFRDLVLVAWAGNRSLESRVDAAESDAWQRLLDAADTWTPVDMPIKGRDLMSMGLPHGPRIGKLLAELEAWWEANDYRPGREEMLQRARAAL